MQLTVIRKACPTFSGIRLNQYWHDMIVLSDVSDVTVVYTSAKLHYNLSPVLWYPATQYWHDLIASVAKDFQDSGLIFAIADEEEYANDLKALGLADWGEDVAVGLFAPGPLKYNMKEELTPESLREFVREFLKGKLVPHRSSEPPPRQSKGTLIKTIVGSTFEKIVLDPKKNVMVKLCVPDLPDCIQANEYYPKVAERYIGDKDIIFGEMNVAVNDPPTGTKFDTLPAFFFSKKDSTTLFPAEVCLDCRPSGLQ